MILMELINLSNIISLYIYIIDKNGKFINKNKNIAKKN